jgi:hypothetical protein
MTKPLAATRESCSRARPETEGSILRAKMLGQAARLARTPVWRDEAAKLERVAAGAGERLPSASVRPDRYRRGRSSIGARIRHEPS